VQEAEASQNVREKTEAAKAEVQRLLEVGFIREVRYLQWLPNVVMVHKKNGNDECVQILPTSTSAISRTIK
jgi:hypothetical protein